MQLISKGICLTGAVVILFSPLQSSADGTSKDQEIAKRFSKCDSNKDGKLTLDEAKGCMPRIYEHFSYIDSEKRGYITLVQIEQLAR
jgi:Ca2+-binding EF-hand superfamily protein